MQRKQTPIQSSLFSKKLISNKETFIDICKKYLKYLQSLQTRSDEQENELRLLIDEKQYKISRNFDYARLFPRYWILVSDAQLIDQLLPFQNEWPKLLDTAYKKFKMQVELRREINLLFDEYSARDKKGQFYASRDIFHLGKSAGEKLEALFHLNVLFDTPSYAYSINYNPYFQILFQGTLKSKLLPFIEAWPMPMYWYYKDHVESKPKFSSCYRR